MTLIKILLIMSFLALLLWAFRNRATVGLRAGIRMGAVTLTVVAIASIINPNISTVVANFLGVGRGTDLLLYVLIVVFAATSVGTYFRFRAQELRIVEIVRAAAIRDAVLLNAPSSVEDQSGRAPSATSAMTHLRSAPAHPFTDSVTDEGPTIGRSRMR